jgi:hypothetical protein
LQCYGTGQGKKRPNNEYTDCRVLTKRLITVFRFLPGTVNPKRGMNIIPCFRGDEFGFLKDYRYLINMFSLDKGGLS